MNTQEETNLSTCNLFNYTKSVVASSDLIYYKPPKKITNVSQL